MAERRMFCKSIIESDAFMDMPAEAQMLYIRLNMAADDDGFCDNPRSVMRACGAGSDTMKILIAKKFVLTFDKNDGFIVVIKHWRMNNYIRKDNYRETKYKEFMRELYYDENRSYSMNPGDGHTPCLPPVTPCIPPVDEPYTGRTQVVDEPLTQDRIGKDSTVKDSGVKDSTGKGECEGGNPPDVSGIPLPMGSTRQEKIDFLKGRIAFYNRMGWDPDCWYLMAAREGITAEELKDRKEINHVSV